MSGSPSSLPPSPSLEQLRKRAKQLLRDFRAGDRAARKRLAAWISAGRLQSSQAEDDAIDQAASAATDGITLAAAQYVLSREHGFENWAKLVHHIAAAAPLGLEPFTQLAKDLAAAYANADVMAIREINWNFGTSFVWYREPDQMHRRLVNWYSSPERTEEMALADAKQLVAHSYGFENWLAFAKGITQPPPAISLSPNVAASSDAGAPAIRIAAPPFYRIDWKTSTLSARGPLTEQNWETVFGVMEEHQLTGLQAGGMTDAAMVHLAKLDQVTHLQFGGSQRLTDEGLVHLAKMPQLLELEVGGWNSPPTDRGLRVLRHLTALRKFTSCWTRGFTDASAKNLIHCPDLAEVNLMGTSTGDGAIRALTGKTKLRRFKTGRLVSDAGLPLLQEFPQFKTWQGGEVQFGLMSFDAEPTDLLLDGPITDEGLKHLAGLDGLVGLGFFWHLSALTPGALKSLAELVNLQFLGCQGQLCNDEAMSHIAAIPRLRMLMGQGTVATDEGFEHLSRSRTLESFWGRECPNLGDRGFAALGRMESLRGLAVSCKLVSDAALSALPSFPALRGLMPMDVPDNGFRHVGRCEQLTDLWCMYCRDTGDIATGHLAGLPHLRSYYAGLSQITDKSLEILARIRSLEELQFESCALLTNAGLAPLATLPLLRKIELAGSPGVTDEGFHVFPPGVRVSHSP